MLLKAEQDARAAKQKNSEEDTEGTAKHQAGKKPGRGGRGRGRGRGGRGKQQSTKGEQQLADEQVEPTPDEGDKKGNPKPAPKGKAKAKAKAKSKPTPKAKSQPSPKGKAKAKAKARAAAPNQDAENPHLDQAELQEAAAVPQQAAAAVPEQAAAVPVQAATAVAEQAAAAVPQQAAANPKKRKASSHPAIPVPTFAHVDLCVYWTRASVGLKLKTSSEKGKQARGLVHKALGYRVWLLHDIAGL